jgi:hypothetical protein
MLDDNQSNEGSGSSSGLIRLCGLWQGKTRKGESMMSGTFSPGVAVFIFKNKKTTDKQPDYQLCIAQKEKREGGAQGSDNGIMG